MVSYSTYYRTLCYQKPDLSDPLVSGPARHRVAVIRQEGSNGDREMLASLHAAGLEVTINIDMYSNILICM